MGSDYKSTVEEQASKEPVVPALPLENITCRSPAPLQIHVDDDTSTARASSILTAPSSVLKPSQYNPEQLSARLSGAKHSIPYTPSPKSRSARSARSKQIDGMAMWSGSYVAPSPKVGPWEGEQG